MSHTVANTDNWEAVKAECEKHLPQHVINFIESVKGQEYAESNLISILHKIQAHSGYLSKEQLNAVSHLAQIPLTKVTGVATFYHYFRLNPKGKHIISVCMGTACYVKGAEKISQKLIDELGIHFGETTKDGLFSLEAARCLGTCGLAPVIMIDEKVFGPMTPNEVGILLDKYTKKAKGGDRG